MSCEKADLLGTRHKVRSVLLKADCADFTRISTGSLMKNISFTDTVTDSNST